MNRHVLFVNLLNYSGMYRAHLFLISFSGLILLMFQQIFQYTVSHKLPYILLDINSTVILSGNTGDIGVLGICEP